MTELVLQIKLISNESIALSADKSLNAYKVFADFRCYKETKEEVNKIKQDGKEIGWLSGHPMDSLVHYSIREAIDARMCVKRYARKAAEQARYLE